VRGEREVLDEAARLALRGVGGAEHTPLRGLQRAGARDLARLLELGLDPGHHPKGADVGEPVQDLRDTRPLHLEALHAPVPGADGRGEPVGDLVAVLGDDALHMEGDPIRLLENLELNIQIKSKHSNILLLKKD
jgi:hypothetical protein